MTALPTRPVTPAQALARPAPAPPPPAAPEAAGNDLLALAAAASTAFVSPRATGGGVVSPRATGGGVMRPTPGAPAAPAAPAADAPPPSSRTGEPGYVPFGLDDGGVMEPGSAGGRPPIAQSGRTVPLSAALLASVVKSVEDKRAAAAGRLPAPIEAAAPPPKKRSRVALVLILLVGFGVFITGVVMFLDAMK